MLCSATPRNSACRKAWDRVPGRLANSWPVRPAIAIRNIEKDALKEVVGNPLDHPELQTPIIQNPVKHLELEHKVVAVAAATLL